MSYKKLEVWQLAKEVAVEVHRMTMVDLPKFEMYEEGSQIRRSAKSVRSNIVEGYGRRNYKQDFIKFLYYALGSNDETIDHLEGLFDCGSLTDEKKYMGIKEKCELLGKKLNNFIKSVEKEHISKK